jgi:1,2-diacylglycerol 3-beta-glucosyltransferase
MFGHWPRCCCPVCSYDVLLLLLAKPMIALLLGCSLLYLGRVVFFLFGFGKRQPRSVRPTPGNLVSVVIPARNEEATIQHAVASVARAHWPADALEIIVVNDRSTDGTAQVLDRLSASVPQLKVVTRTDADVDANLRGKPGALQQGIEAATGDVVLLTDADCEVNPDWIAAMTRAIYQRDVAMVCATTSSRHTLVAGQMQDVEWAFSNAMARAGLQMGVPLGCFGNNLGLRRDVFMAMGGYRGIPFSVTEDLALLQTIINRGHSVAYLCDAASSVETLPCITFMDYVRQRQRWARGGTALGMRALAFVITSLALWLGLAVAAFTGQWAWFVGIAIMRIIADASLVGWALVRLRRPGTLPWVIPTVVMLMLTELALPFLVLRKNVVWKGQVFKS